MQDRRVRIRPRPGGEDYVYGDNGGNTRGLLTVLRNTDGLIFPTTPTISVSQAAEYESVAPTHSIAAYNTFKSTKNTTINVSGDFFVGNSTEALYLLAATHFFRTVTKMDFGRTSKTRGTPPPVLLFSAYGNYQFNDIPVIVKSVSFDYRNDVDYIQVPVSGLYDTLDTDLYNILAGEEFAYASQDFFQLGKTDKEEKVWVPQQMTFDISLEQQPTGEYVSKTFNLNSFKRGELLTRGGFI